MFSINLDNIGDKSIPIRSVNVLDYIGKSHNDFILSEAEYYTADDINELYISEVE